MVSVAYVLMGIEACFVSRYSQLKQLPLFMKSARLHDRVVYISYLQ